MTVRLSGVLTDREDEISVKPFTNTTTLHSSTDHTMIMMDDSARDYVSYLDSSLATGQTPSLGPPLDLLLVPAT